MRLIYIHIFVFTYITNEAVNCLALDSIADLEGFFNLVTDFDQFNKTVNHKDQKETTNKTDQFKRLINWVRYSRDEQLDVIRSNALKIAEASSNSASNPSDDCATLPQWPSCCGLNSVSRDVFRASVSLKQDEQWLQCYEPMDPTGERSPIFSLFEIECVCQTYAESSLPCDHMFSYEMAEAMRNTTQQEDGQDGLKMVQVLVGNFNGTAAIYPGNDDGTFFGTKPCDTYDPRNRMWLMQLTEKANRHFHFFLDFSPTMKNVRRPGGMKSAFIIEQLVGMFAEQLVQVRDTHISVYQMENVSNNITLGAFEQKSSIQSKLVQFFSKAMLHEIIKLNRNEDMMAILDGVDFDGSVVIMSDYKMHDIVKRNNVYLLNFGSTKYGESANVVTQMADEFENGELLRHVYYTIKNRIISYRKTETLGITSPYVDFMGGGEIVTIGFPINKNGNVVGAAAIDTPILTHGVRNGPYKDSVFFDGRFDSFLVILNLHQNVVLSHPLKASHGFDVNAVNVRGNSIDEMFRTDEERQMIEGLKGEEGTTEPFVRLISNFEYPVGKTRDITYYWLLSKIMNGKNMTDEIIAYGIAVVSDEEELLAEKIDEVLGIYSLTDDNTRVNTSCSDVKTIRDFYNDNTLKRLNNRLTTDVDYVHLTPEVIRNPTFGSDYESEQFDFYNVEFKSCLAQGTYLTEKCRDLFTPRAFEEVCELQNSRDFGKWMYDNQDGMNVKEKVRSIYIASVGGLFKSYGVLPPYGYNPTFRPWYEHSLHHDGLQFTIYNDKDNSGPVIVTMTKRIVKSSSLGVERKYVVAVDINYELFRRLGQKTCETWKRNTLEQNDSTNDFTCAIYTPSGHLIYHDEFDREELRAAHVHTAASTDRQIVSLKQADGTASVVECFNRETKKCEVYSVQLNTSDEVLKNDSCLQYRFIDDGEIRIILRNKPTGLGCDGPRIDENSCFSDGNSRHLPFCPKNQREKKKEKDIYKTCEDMPCGCSFFDKEESSLSMFCARINQYNGSMERCNESPYCRFERDQCRPLNDSYDLLDKRRKLCDNEKSLWGWISGSVIIALLTVLMSIITAFVSQRKSKTKADMNTSKYHLSMTSG